MRRLPFLLVATIVVSPAANSALATILIDDFSQPAQVTEISRGSNFVRPVTENVGELNATRTMTVFANQTSPNDWNFDSGVSSPSLLTATINGHTQPPRARSAILSMYATYVFEAKDLSENGLSDAFLFDFVSHTGTVAPFFFRMSARGSYPTLPLEVRSQDIMLNADSFTIAIPFSSFGIRGGGIATPNWSEFDTLAFEFFFFRAPSDMEWSVQLDRFRIGSTVIPEPSSLFLVVSCMWLISWRMRLRTIRSIEPKGVTKHVQEDSSTADYVIDPLCGPVCDCH